MITNMNKKIYLSFCFSGSYTASNVINTKEDPKKKYFNNIKEDNIQIRNTPQRCLLPHLQIFYSS